MRLKTKKPLDTKKVTAVERDTTGTASITVGRDDIIGTKTEHGQALMLTVIYKREGGLWSSKWMRLQFRVFSVLDIDSACTDVYVSKILKLPVLLVDRIMIQLMMDKFIVLRRGTGKKMDLNREILIRTFQGVKLIGNVFAESFYKDLFTDRLEDDLSTMMLRAEIRGLFSAVDMQRQYNALMGALAFVVAGIEEGADIRKALLDLGKKHTGYGVKNTYYPLVGDSLIRTMKLYLVSVWNDEIEAAWKDAYEIICSLMLAEN